MTQLDMGINPAPPRFPTKPLLEACGMTATEFAKRWDVDFKTLCSWLGLTADMADECAVKAGFMPHEIWPDWYRLTAELVIV